MFRLYVYVCIGISSESGNNDNHSYVSYYFVTKKIPGGSRRIDITYTINKLAAADRSLNKIVVRDNDKVRF